HQEIDDERTDLRNVVLARNVADSEDHRRDEATLDGPCASDGNDETDIHHVLERKRRIEAEDIDAEATTQPRESRAQRERHAENAVDVDAESGGCYGIV